MRKIWERYLIESGQEFKTYTSAGGDQQIQTAVLADQVHFTLPIFATPFDRHTCSLVWLLMHLWCPKRVNDVPEGLHVHTVPVHR